MCSSVKLCKLWMLLWKYNFYQRRQLLTCVYFDANRLRQQRLRVNIESDVSTERGTYKWEKNYINPVPEIIDTVFAKTSAKRSFSITEYDRFWLVFTKTRVCKFEHRALFQSWNLQTSRSLLKWIDKLYLLSR